MQAGASLWRSVPKLLTGTRPRRLRVVHRSPVQWLCLFDRTSFHVGSPWRKTVGCRCCCTDYNCKRNMGDDFKPFPHFATNALHVGQDPDQWNSKAVVPHISLSTTFKQESPGNPKVSLRGVGWVQELSFLAGCNAGGLSAWVGGTVWARSSHSFTSAGVQGPP